MHVCLVCEPCDGLVPCSGSYPLLAQDAGIGPMWQLVFEFHCFKLLYAGVSGEAKFNFVACTTRIIHTDQLKMWFESQEHLVGLFHLSFRDHIPIQSVDVNKPNVD